MAMYRGFSTLQGNFNTTKITDSDLLKRDLLNSFAIRKGEKVGRPDFGSNILDLIMEPLTAEVKNLLLEEVTSTIAQDPRVSLQHLVIDEYENGLQAQIELLYVQSNQSEKLVVNFDRQDGTIN
jgi:phage baseplate assembly protein W|tara:strand:+ start:248 stop:619 length:372 start_codon:yes stop_codon:yes gene_type:complete